jgi:hypothetical protein
MSSPAALPAHRRARRRLGLVGVAMAVLLLGACTGRPPTPTSYGDTTRTNFLRGCLDVAREDDSGVSDPEDYCRCTYTAIRAQIPFEQFKEINSDLSDDPGSLPPKLQQIRDDCIDRTSGSG